MFIKNSFPRILGVVLLAVFLATCTMATPSPTPPFGIDIDPRAVTLGPEFPFDPELLLGTPAREVCPPESYVRIAQPFTPRPFSIVDRPNAFISWTYPEYCDPPSWNFELGLFGVDSTVSPPTFYPTPIVEEIIPGHYRSQVVPVEPGKTYNWAVWPSDGDYLSLANGSTFDTGPVCASADLDPPLLLNPLNNATIDSLSPLLHIGDNNYGLCSPEETWIDLSTDPAFSSTSPWHRERGRTVNIVASDLLDCTQYYWRAAYMKDGTRGTFSPTFNFYTNGSGTCVRERAAISATLNTSVLCLEGPHPSFDVVSVIEAQTVVELLGIAQTGNWFIIAAPGSPGLECWVDMGAVDVDPNLDFSELVVYPIPPLPGGDNGGDGGPPPSGPPAAPSNLHVISKGCDQTNYIINLGWNDNSNNEQGFRLFRQAANQNSPQLLATLGPNAASYTDQVTDGQTYTYFLEAYNAAGASSRVQVSVPTMQCLI